MSRSLARATRPKKLTTKQHVQIFREEQVDNINDHEAVRTQIETGVEKAEESVSSLTLFFPLITLTTLGISSSTGHTRRQSRCIYPNTTNNLK